MTVQRAFHERTRRRLFPFPLSYPFPFFRSSVLPFFLHLSSLFGERKGRESVRPQNEFVLVRSRSWSISIRRLRSSQRAILWPRGAARAITLIKHRVHIGNNGRRAWNRVKRRSSSLVGIIQTSARRSRSRLPSPLAAPARRLSILVTFPRWNPDAMSSGRPRADR